MVTSTDTFRSLLIIRGCPLHTTWQSPPPRHIDGWFRTLQGLSLQLNTACTMENPGGRTRHTAIIQLSKNDSSSQTPPTSKPACSGVPIAFVQSISPQTAIQALPLQTAFGFSIRR